MLKARPPVLRALSTMRKPLQHRPTEPESRVAGLEPAKIIFTFLANLGSGACNIPGLQAVAQIVVQIIDVAQVCVPFPLVTYSTRTHCA